MVDTEWVENLKRIVLQAVEAGDPCDVIPGVVTGVVPMTVQIDQKTTVSGGQLLIPAHLTDRTVEMSIPELGEVSVVVKNSLKAGENVLLLQKRGGQQYLVIDRW